MWAVLIRACHPKSLLIRLRGLYGRATRPGVVCQRHGIRIQPLHTGQHATRATPTPFRKASRDVPPISLVFCGNRLIRACHPTLRKTLARKRDQAKPDLPCCSCSDNQPVNNQPVFCLTDPVQSFHTSRRCARSPYRSRHSDLQQNQISSPCRCLRSLFAYLFPRRSLGGQSHVCRLRKAAQCRILSRLFLCTIRILILSMLCNHSLKPTRHPQAQRIL